MNAADEYGNTWQGAARYLMDTGTSPDIAFQAAARQFGLMPQTPRSMSPRQGHMGAAAVGSNPFTNPAKRKSRQKGVAAQVVQKGPGNLYSREDMQDIGPWRQLLMYGMQNPGSDINQYAIGPDTWSQMMEMWQPRVGWQGMMGG